MRTFFFLILAGICLILQTTLLRHLPDILQGVDLIFLLSIFISLRFDFLRGGTLVLLCGLCLDIFSGALLGPHFVSYLLLFLVLQGLSINLVFNDTSHQPPLTVLCYLPVTACTYFLYAALTPESSLAWSWSQVLLNTLVLSSLSIPASLFFGRLLAMLEKKKARRRLAMQSRTGNAYR